MLFAVDYIFNLLCTVNSLQPMKKFVFSVASRATGRLQIKPSGSGDENVPIRNRMGRLPHFFSYGAPSTRGASRRAWSSTIKTNQRTSVKGAKRSRRTFGKES